MLLAIIPEPDAAYHNVVRPRRSLDNQTMDPRETDRCWEQNADAWTRLARQGFDVYRDAVAYFLHIRCRKPAG